MQTPHPSRSPSLEPEKREVPLARRPSYSSNIVSLGRGHVGYPTAGFSARFSLIPRETLPRLLTLLAYLSDRKRCARGAGILSFQLASSFDSPRRHASPMIGEIHVRFFWGKNTWTRRRPVAAAGGGPARVPSGRRRLVAVGRLDLESLPSPSTEVPHL